MDTRRKIILAVLVAVAIIMIGLFFWLMFGPKAKLPPAGNANVNGNVESNINAEPVGPIPPPSAERQAEAKDYPLGLKQVAATFAERYLSYSSDQPNKNLADLSPLMTLKMQAVARELVDAGSQTGSAPGFVGYSAKALNSELISSDAAKAEVLVSLQRTQYSGDNPGPKVFYQEMTLQFVKIGADWRVDLLEVK